MQNYIGTKDVKATPMARGEYNYYRGWEVPEDESPDDEGYLVEYVDSPNKNHPDHDGYISWSPKDVFEAHYRRLDKLTFGDVIHGLKQGKRYARKDWVSDGRFIVLTWGSVDYINKKPEIATFDDGTSVEIYPKAYVKSNKGFLIPWRPTLANILAEDWCEVCGSAAG